MLQKSYLIRCWEKKCEPCLHPSQILSEVSNKESNILNDLTSKWRSSKISFDIIATTISYLKILLQTLNKGILLHDKKIFARKKDLNLKDKLALVSNNRRNEFYAKHVSSSAFVWIS